MRSRIRVVRKIGKGTYYTQNWGVSEYIWVNICYYIFIFPIIVTIYLICYIPYWTIKKIILYINNKNNNGGM